MEHSELLRHAVSVLERLGVPYFVTGSVATAYFGEPRFTNDIDVVADLPLDWADEFCAAFPAADYYVSSAAVPRRSSVETSSTSFTPLPASKLTSCCPRGRRSTKADWRGGCGYSRTPVTRRGSFPEDVIVKKMDFYREGGSEKHLRDITGILKVMGDRIDRGYILEWAARLVSETSGRRSSNGSAVDVDAIKASDHRDGRGIEANRAGVGCQELTAPRPAGAATGDAGEGPARLVGPPRAARGTAAAVARSGRSGGTLRER